MKRLKFLELALISIPVLWLFSCSTSVQNVQPYKLPSGRIVRVQGMMPITFSQGPPALMLKYETDLMVSDKPPLKQEVSEIWDVFRADVERGNFQSAIISANEKPSGFILKRSNAYNFVYEKRADGRWHNSEEDKQQ